jgi:hypothetical protein
VKRTHKFAIAIAATVLVLIGSSYGAWVAWDGGLVGDNPRAPVLVAMEGAVRMQALISSMRHDSGNACIPIDLNSPPPEVIGLPGVSMSSAPGGYAVTLLRQTDIRYQPARDIQFGQMDYLVTQGLLSARDVSVGTNNGPRPARSYNLTWAGFAAIQPNYGSSLCLPYGRREFAKIDKIEKLLEKVLDLDVYEATYTTKVVDVPAWAATDAAGQLFPKLPALTAVSSGKAKVIRAKNGWRSAYEVEMEAISTSKGPQITDYLKQMTTSLERVAPTPGEAKELVMAQTLDANWVAQNGFPCLPLQIRLGGDDKIAPGTQRETQAFTVTYYDRADRKEYEYKTMVNTLHVLSALEGAGLAQMEHLKQPSSQKGKPARGSAPSVFATQNAGIRYRVSPEAVETLALMGNRGGCVPAGRLKVEMLAMHSNRGTVEITARGSVEQTPEWAAKIGARLPALKTLIEIGLPLSGRMAFVPEGGAGKWRIGDLTTRYPETSFNVIPAHLVPLMPLTVASFPVKPVTAPALMQQAPVTPERTPVVSIPSTATQPAQSPPPSPVAARVTPVSPPYPAEGSPVHVVSIYQATQPGNAQRGIQQHPEGVVNLIVNEPDAVLLLSSYEPVEWHISAPKDIALKRVIAIGHQAQRVTFAGGGKPQVVVTRTELLKQQTGIDLRHGFPTRNETNDLVDIMSISHALTGATPRSFQAKYESSPQGFVIGSQTPVFVLPERRAPDSGGNAVTLRSAFAEAVEGSRLLRGSSGAYTDAWSDRAYSAGRVYYEGRMRVTGALAAHTHANLGLCLVRGNTIEQPPGGTAIIRHGEQKLYKDGDVFGVAADFEQQRLYYHVNGKWVTGLPGSGNGISLEKGKEYRACLFAAGTTSGDVKNGNARSDTTWEINFGDRPFSKAVPPGYVAFQGKKVQ